MMSDSLKINNDHDILPCLLMLLVYHKHEGSKGYFWLKTCALILLQLVKKIMTI